MRSGARLGVVLHAEHGVALVRHALERAVVQVDVRRPELATGDRVDVDRVVVVLAGDLDLAGHHVLDRRVGAVMAVRQLERPPADRQPQQLMPHADPVRREEAQHLPDGVVGVLRTVRIAWAVGEDQPVRIERHDLRRRGLRGHDDHLGTGLLELVHDRVLDAEVDHHDPRRLLEAGARVRKGRRHLGRHVATVDVLVVARLLDQLGLERVVDRTVMDHALDHAARAQPTGQGAGVDPLDPDDQVLLHEALKILVRAVVAGRTRELAHDEAARERSVRLHVVDRDPVVPDVGIGHRHDLAVVARIGQDLLVAGHRGVEHDLSDRPPGVTERVAVVHRAVLERQRRRRFVQQRHRASQAGG